MEDRNIINVAKLIDANPASPSLLTWQHLVLRFEALALDFTQVLGGRAWEALIGQPHVLLPDGQGAVQTLTGQLKVVHGHLKYDKCYR